MADWSRLEVELIVADYFSMLNAELTGTPYNKAAHRRTLLPLLQNRSEGSIEFKHQNISAALIRLGMPYILGYKPLFNYQKDLLERAILDYVQMQKTVLEPKFEAFADQDAASKAGDVDFNDFLEPAPDKGGTSEPEVGYRRRRPFKINYLEREQMNMSLGEKGEQLILAYERWQLERAGKAGLAEQVRWIANEDDGAGFDILSKNPNGTDKYIEVKTTKLSKEAPFFFSRNEYEFSKAKAGDYHLYRVFQFAKSPRMFRAQGSFDAFCRVEVIGFKGSF